MRFTTAIILMLAAMIWQPAKSQDTLVDEKTEQMEPQALFIKEEAFKNLEKRAAEVVKESGSPEMMVQNILHWLQNIYMQNNRKIRQNTLREYLPPLNTEKPRPFQSNEGYPPSGGPPPQPPFNYIDVRALLNTNTSILGVQPTVSVGGATGYTPTRPQQISSSSESPFIGQFGGTSAAEINYIGGSDDGYQYNQPSSQSPSQSSSQRPIQTTQRPIQQAERFGPQTQRPIQQTQRPFQETQRPIQQTQRPIQQTQRPVQVTQRPVQVTQRPYQETQRPFQETQRPYQETTSQPFSTTTDFDQYETTRGPVSSSRRPAAAIRPVSSTSSPYVPPRFSGGDDDDNHPPHIHAINVDCAKDMMTINLEFNREYNGIIYSKGFYGNPDCRYVLENSNQKEYRFTVSLNSCGTEFVNGFTNGMGQSYLENVLVLQNEVGIQEVWDSVRAVRCLWAGNLNKALSVALSVGTLSQEVVTFSGDTAMARLDIQIGRGPFAPPANGLVKIGEIMTLVVSVSGDNAFEVHVRDCRARDMSGEHTVQLTDENGCILKPKLFGAFQTTRDTGNTGSSLIAYAYFSAFKFPDIMDLVLECNVELCKTDCQMCTDPGQKIDPGRRKRRSVDENEELLKISKTIRVVMPEELPKETQERFVVEQEGLCITSTGLYAGILTLTVPLFISCLFSILIWTKYQKAKRKC